MVYPGKDSRLVYIADELGNKIPDFSNVGFGGGGISIPTVPVVMELTPLAGDNTEHIQAAIDKLSQLQLGKDGFRGALLLHKGRYPLAGSLHLRASGIVLRGEGPKDTVLVGTGRGQRVIIEVAGTELKRSGSSRTVLDKYVPVGSRTLRAESAKTFRPGDTVLVRRFGNAAWIHELGMDHIMRRPGNPDQTHDWEPFNIDFDRLVTAVHDDVIEFDAPIVCAIDEKWGGGAVIPYSDQDRLRNIGIENLRGESEFNHAVTLTQRDTKYMADEDHAWTFIAIGHAVNVWVRNVAAAYFGQSCVRLDKGSKFVTVEDCACGAMVSELTGSRRYAFFVEAGQLCLVRRCWADTARHSFVVGARVGGPNVFFNCKAGTQYNSSEPHHRWSVGGLYDNVKANIAIQDREWMGSGHGWAGANYVAWNCEGSLICQKPPTAQNYAIGQVGERERGAFDRPAGYWESYGTHVTPESLYLSQLEDRLGK
jgi:hypothetical protein